MTYTFKIKGDTTDALRGMQKLRSAVSGISGKVQQVEKDTQKSTRSMGNGFDSLARSVRGLIGAYLGLNAVQQVFQTGMQRERMTNFIKMMAGSASETKRITNDIISMSAGMGVNVNSMGETFGMMSQVMDKANALEMTKRVGLVASFSGFDPRGIGLNLMQMASAGKAFADMMDIRQLMEKYPLFLKYIAKVKGVTSTEANLGLKQGRYLTGEEAVKAFAMMTDQGSELSKFLDEYTKSFLFKWGQMKVQLQNTAVNIYTALMPFLNFLVKILNNIGAGLSKINPLWQDLLKIVGTLKSLLTDLFQVFKTLGETLIYTLSGLLKIINWIIEKLKPLHSIIGFIIISLTIMKGVLMFESAIAGVNGLLAAFRALKWELLAIVAGALFLQEFYNQIKAGGLQARAKEIADQTGLYTEIYTLQAKSKGLYASMMGQQPGSVGYKAVEKMYNENMGLLTEKQSKLYRLQSDNLAGVATRIVEGLKLNVNAIKEQFGEKLTIGTTKFETEAVKGATTDAAMDTGNLYGAHGGLGDSKVIHLHFNKALVENNIANADSKTIMKSSDDAADYILKIINNLAFRQSYAY